MDCGLKIIRAQGVGALFRGTPATVLRDTPSLGVYFASYEFTKDWLKRRGGFGEQVSSFGAGGLAGGLSWLVIYPLDVVKSVQQVRRWRWRRGMGGRGRLPYCSEGKVQYY